MHRFTRLMIAVAIGLSSAAWAASYCVTDPPRPAASSTGFYVAKANTQRATSSADTSWRIYDPAGNEFKPIGVNHNHWDAWGSYAGVPRSGANTVRAFLRFTDPPATTWGFLKPYVDAGLVTIPTNWTTTCNPDPAALARAVDTWVAQASTWTQLNDKGVINIANEWGPNSVVWRDSYITAVGRMRAAGYTGLLMVDAGGCGQDARVVVNYGAQVLDADPLHNIVFGVHVYGSWHVITPKTPWQSWWGFTYGSQMQQLRASGLPVIISEFGPMGVGPSQTPVPPEQLIADAEAAGWGWLAWSWDDNNADKCQSTDVGGFGMTRNCGAYTGDDLKELTAWGRTLVPLLKARAASAVR